jgi:hypothetical protein
MRENAEHAIYSELQILKFPHVETNCIDFRNEMVFVPDLY